jgi:hypothetical protein
MLYYIMSLNNWDFISMLGFVDTNEILHSCWELLTEWGFTYMLRLADMDGTWDLGLHMNWLEFNKK